MISLMAWLVTSRFYIGRHPVTGDIIGYGAMRYRQLEQESHKYTLETKLITKEISVFHAPKTKGIHKGSGPHLRRSS